MAYKHILVPVDGSETSLAAVKQAACIAKAFSSKVTAVCVLAVDPFVAVEFVNTDQFINDYVAKAKEEIQEILEQAKSLFAQEGVTAETQILEGQTIHKVIVEATKDLGADLIVIGSHGRKGIKKLFLGSVTQAILSEGTVPVLVVHK
ncbi:MULTISPECIES: universal stress protein [unclassified Acinetobacter]|uniref:universal stress protein n=1 Tax=unclassified Acinetobacter TaxID=196816 RepID=UPI001038713F|nr:MULTISPECIES: universal stress protein [unclassified Acinetobacter]TCB11003.1 universal stress protein [Acinetobacter sp. ANC 4641]TCB24349.1 universal stress protein [Acinetobacter sp. ANC 4633]